MHGNTGIFNGWVGVDGIYVGGTMEERIQKLEKQVDNLDWHVSHIKDIWEELKKLKQYIIDIDERVDGLASAEISDEDDW